MQTIGETKEYYLCNYRQTACPYATLNGYCKLTACIRNIRERKEE